MGIVTGGLVSYWNSKQGVSGNVWENIAPATKGNFNGVITGATLTENGMYFDGVDDFVKVNTTQTRLPFTFEAVLSFPILNSSMNNVAFWGAYQSTFVYWTLITVNNSLSLIARGDAVGSLNQEIIKLNPKETYHLVITSSLANGTAIFINGSRVLGGSSLKSASLQSGDYYFGKNNLTAYTNVIFRSVRIYSSILTPQEIAQNYAVGAEVGLEKPVAQEIPEVNSITIDKYAVSRIIGSDVSTLEFSFNEDVTEWKVVLLGVSHDTGTLLDSGGIISANKKVFSVVYGKGLYQEGLNRINVYGKNEAGWTVYET